MQSNLANTETSFRKHKTKTQTLQYNGITLSTGAAALSSRRAQVRAPRTRQKCAKGRDAQGKNRCKRQREANWNRSTTLLCALMGGKSVAKRQVLRRQAAAPHKANSNKAARVFQKRGLLFSELQAPEQGSGGQRLPLSTSLETNTMPTPSTGLVASSPSLPRRRTRLSRRRRLSTALDRLPRQRAVNGAPHHQPAMPHATRPQEHTPMRGRHRLRHQCRPAPRRWIQRNGACPAHASRLTKPNHSQSSGIPSLSHAVVAHHRL